jgi:hypothetical protein
MAKAKIRLTTPELPPVRKKRAAGSLPTTESLFMLRIKELDREFARQTKQLTALTKKFGKKLTEPINLKKPSKH